MPPFEIDKLTVTATIKGKRLAVKRLLEEIDSTAKLLGVTVTYKEA